MKIDLTSRDIELMMLLLQETVADKLEMNDADVLMLEEFALLEKLESALRNSDANEQETLDIAKVTNVYH